MVVPFRIDPASDDRPIPRTESLPQETRGAAFADAFSEYPLSSQLFRFDHAFARLRRRLSLSGYYLPSVSPWEYPPLQTVKARLSFGIEFSSYSIRPGLEKADSKPVTNRLLDILNEQRAHVRNSCSILISARRAPRAQSVMSGRASSMLR